MKDFSFSGSLGVGWVGWEVETLFFKYSLYFAFLQKVLGDFFFIHVPGACISILHVRYKVVETTAEM